MGAPGDKGPGGTAGAGAELGAPYGNKGAAPGALVAQQAGPGQPHQSDPAVPVRAQVVLQLDICEHQVRE